MNLKTCFEHYVTFAVTLIESMLAIIDNYSVWLPSNQAILRRRAVTLRGIVDRMLIETDGNTAYYAQFEQVNEYTSRFTNGIKYMGETDFWDCLYLQHDGLTLIHELQRD